MIQYHALKLTDAEMADEDYCNAYSLQRTALVVDWIGLNNNAYIGFPDRDYRIMWQMMIEE